MIIHISGPSGSGKTVLGNKLKNKLKNKVVVKDLDDLRGEFINKFYNTSKSWSFDQVKYQKYINDFIKKTKKTLIFVGLNDNHFGANKNLYYNLQADHKYFIDIGDKIIIEQKCERFVKTFIPLIYDDHKNNVQEFIKIVTHDIKKNVV